MTTASAPTPLGEVDLPALLDSMFQLGELLAHVNAQGNLLPPGFLAVTSPTMPLGKWAVRDPARMLPLPAEGLTPETAAQQFAEYDAELRQALLAGYGRKAYQVLEPRYPGFTEQVLALLLPAPVPHLTQPRPINYDLARVLQAYGAHLQIEGFTRQLVFASPGAPLIPPTDEELVVACAVLFAGELNLTAWLTQVAACEPARELAQLFGALARGELHESTWGGLIPRLLGANRPQRQLRARLARQPWPLNLLLGLLEALYDTPERLATIYEEKSCFRLLRATLDQLPSGPADSPAARETWLAHLMDGLDYLALVADAQGNPHASLDFAQASVMALQLLPSLRDPLQAEAWLSRVEAQEYQYQWQTLSPNQPLEKYTVWRFASYACSVRLTAEAFCDQVGEWYVQGRVRNQLWSATWHALAGLRQGLRLCYALAQQRALSSDEDQKTQGYVLKSLLDHYQQAQRKLAAMMQRPQQRQQDMSFWVQSLLDAEPTSWERTQIGGDMARAEAVRTELHQRLRTSGYTLDVHKRLAELVASLAEQVVGADAEQQGRAAYGPEYLREEEQVYQDVLADLLWQEYLKSFSALHHADGTPVVLVPPELTTRAERHAYYEAYLAAHPDEFTPPGVLNLAPTLRSMAECRAEYEFLLDQPTLPGRTHALQELLQESVMAHLIGRDFTPDPAPPAGRYTLYWRYEPFHQYPEPVGSWGQQLGLHLSRVCLNVARDTGFFFYDLDHNQYILGHVALVRKQQGRWQLQQEEPRQEGSQEGSGS